MSSAEPLGPDVDQALARALSLGEEGDWEGAATTLRDALADDPDSSDVLCWLGVAERELGLEGIAYERFRACVALEPTDPTVLATAGNGLASFDDPGAEPALRTAALLAPDLPLTRWMYGAYLSREGLVTDALRELDAAVELDPTLDTARYERGVALALAGDLVGAIDDLDEAARMAGDDGWIRSVLGLALVEADRGDEAVGELDRAARSRPADVELQMVAAMAGAVYGYEEVAWEMLERARLSGGAADMTAVLEIEEQMDSGEGMAELLHELAASALRARLMVRP